MTTLIQNFEIKRTFYKFLIVRLITLVRTFQPFSRRQLELIKSFYL